MAHTCEPRAGTSVRCRSLPALRREARGELRDRFGVRLRHLAAFDARDLLRANPVEILRAEARGVGAGAEALLPSSSFSMLRCLARRAAVEQLEDGVGGGLELAEANGLSEVRHREMTARPTSGPPGRRRAQRYDKDLRVPRYRTSTRAAASTAPPMNESSECDDAKTFTRSG